MTARLALSRLRHDVRECLDEAQGIAMYWKRERENTAALARLRGHCLEVLLNDLRLLLTVREPLKEDVQEDVTEASMLDKTMEEQALLWHKLLLQRYRETCANASPLCDHASVTESHRPRQHLEQRLRDTTAQLHQCISLLERARRSLDAAVAEAQHWRQRALRAESLTRPRRTSSPRRCPPPRPVH